MLALEGEVRVNDYGSLNDTGRSPQSISIIKLRLKEAVFELRGISMNSSVGDFKSKVAGCTGIPVERQRLVIGGRRIEPNSSPLRDFNIKENDSIYLFPLPLLPAAAESVAINDSDAHQVQRWINVPEVTLAARELQFCCQELVAVSDLFVLMDLLYFFGTENFGCDTAYSLVVLGDFVLSGISSNFGNWGLSVTPATLPIFVQRVKAMCIICSVYRILWALSFPTYAQYLTDLSLQHGRRKPPLAVVYEDNTAFIFLILTVCFFSVGSWMRYVNISCRLQEALAQHAAGWGDTLPLLQTV